MESGDISQDQATKFLEALALDKFLFDKEVAEAMDGSHPKLSREEESTLDSIGSDLPGKIRQWQAAADGCVIPKGEVSDEL